MRSLLVRGAIVTTLFACLAIPVRAARQTPGDGWLFLPSPERTIRVLFWELANQTEVWVRITPRQKNGVEISGNLVFSGQYKGNVSKGDAITGPPDQMTLLAQANPMTFYSTPVLELSGDDGHPLTLSPPGSNAIIVSPGPTGGTTSIRILMTPATLTSLTENATVTGNVLGMECHLEHEDLVAIREFARAIHVLK